MLDDIKGLQLVAAAPVVGLMVDESVLIKLSSIYKYNKQLQEQLYLQFKAKYC
jgi:hypothetical protein